MAAAWPAGDEALTAAAKCAHAASTLGASQSTSGTGGACADATPTAVGAGAPGTGGACADVTTTGVTTCGASSLLSVRVTFAGEDGDGDGDAGDATGSTETAAWVAVGVGGAGPV